MKQFLFALALVFMVSGCTQPPQPPQIGDLDVRIREYLVTRYHKNVDPNAEVSRPTKVRLGNFSDRRQAWPAFAHVEVEYEFESSTSGRMRSRNMYDPERGPVCYVRATGENVWELFNPEK